MEKWWRITVYVHIFVIVCGTKKNAARVICTAKKYEF